MPVVVQKYGGSSVADPDKLLTVARRVVATREAGKDVVVVVSAMGRTTDELLQLAREIAPDPSGRELDMLLSVGERITMSLLCMAIQSLGHEAISFTGSQCGIITNDAHSKARIIEVRPVRIQDELANGRIVIVAGYQGVSYKREITTLGRGGSDTTAVALAAALGAEYCEICSDVDGVCSADPNVVPEARRIAELGYEQMQEMATSGARVLAADAVEFAKNQGIAIYLRAADGGEGTLVRKADPARLNKVTGVTHEERVMLLHGDPGILDGVLGFLDEQQAPGKQLVHLEGEDGGLFSLLISAEGLMAPDALINALRERFGEALSVNDDLAAVSLLGEGISEDHRNLRHAAGTLAEAGIAAQGTHTSRFRITFLVSRARVQDTARLLHRVFVEEQAV